MKPVLVVAYYFPPRGGAGTQRFAKFCKYLPEFGFEPVVLTSRTLETDRNAPHDDPSLATGADLVVERVGDAGSGSWQRRALRRLRFFLDADEWADVAAERATGLVREHAPAAVITTLSPFACYRIGLRLKRELGLPWLVDLRDPWSLDGWRRYRSALHARYDLRHMRTALTSADCVIANVPEAAAEFVALGADARRTVVIPNGFDEDDFAAAAAARSDDGHFDLVHMGTLHALDHAGGFTKNTPLLRRHRQIAPLGRTGHYLLHAADLLRARDPAAFARLRIHLYGHVDDSHRRLIGTLRLDDTVRLHGYVAHAETVAALCSSDAVFVPLHDVPAGERALVVPGKLYEALASERAVLAALPPGDGRDLVRAANAGKLVGPTDADALSRALGELIEAHARGEPVRGARRGHLPMFTRRHLADLLARALRGAIAGDARIDVESPWAALAAQESA